MLEDEAIHGHGMGTELEQKDWVNMTLEDLKALGPYYPELDQSVEIVWHSPRPFSSASIVTTKLGQYLIKRSHHSFRSVADLLEEHSFIQHLAQKKISVAQLIANIKGVTATALDGWIYEVHQKINAEDVYAQQHSWKSFFYPEHAYSAGMLLANMHVAALDFKSSQRQSQYLIANQRLLEAPCIVAAIEKRIAESAGLSRYFENQKPNLSATFVSQVTQFHAALLPSLTTLPRLWTHNDLHASNMLWTDASPQAQVAAVIDFGLSDLSTVAYDFAVAIERNFIDWLQLDPPHQLDIHIDLKGLAYFVRGYFAAGGSADALSHVTQMMPLAHIDFALYELEYFVEITHNMSHADAAYRYLIDHTAWFCHAPGLAFLAQLQALIQRRGQDE